MGSGEILWRLGLDVGWEKVVCWSTKAAISLKRVEIEEKLLWRTYRKSTTLFRPVPSPTPTASSSARLGFATLSQNSNRYYLRNGWSYELQIWPKRSHGPSEQKPIKNFGKKGAWAYPGTAHWVPPIISGIAKLYELQILYEYSWHQSKEKAIKNFGKVAVGNWA